MEVKDLVELMRNNHSWLLLGSKNIAKLFHIDVNKVYEARDILRKERGLKRYYKYHTLHMLSRQNNFPKILIFDIETSPMKAYIWKLWKLNTNIDHIIDEWFVICWSAKWLYSTEVMGDCLTPEEALEENDKRVTTSLWKLFNEADIVVAHNGQRFDIPKMNSRFIINGLKPPTPYLVVDTLQVAKKQFGFSSNKLDALAGYFGFDHKLDTDFELWRGCLEGDQESLDYMLKYNKRDVTLLEEVYLKLRPWIKNHPNIGNYLDTDKPVCSNCGSDKVKLIDNAYYYTSVGKYPLYLCKCGCISRGRTSIKEKKINNTSLGH